MTTRLSEPDGLRGLAAVAVLLNHVAGTAIPESVGPFALWNPLAWIASVGWAVTLFFVLSGFVLALPYVDGKAPQWPVFFLRRICRLWPTVALATLLGALAWLATPLSFADGRCAALGPAVLEHLLLTGATCLDGPIWSLVHEARFSLAFPLLVLGAVRWPAMAGVASVGLLAALPHQAETTFTMTAHYAGAFVAGILAARYRRALDCSTVSPLTATVVAAMAVLMLRVGTDILVTAASVVLMMLALSGWGRRLLRGAVVQWLGRVSYSLYLLHVPVVLLAATLPLSRWVGAAVAVSASLVISEVAYRWVEVPGIALGRRLTIRLAEAGLEPRSQARRVPVTIASDRMAARMR
jgi:peptidoglycan/LPS O-acetylase OafA/YrhL